MHDYELTVVFQPDLDEKGIEEALGQVKTWMPTDSSEDAKEAVLSHWGKRKMAYQINKFKEGYYVLIEAEMDPTKLSDLERNIRYSDQILRHLVIRKEE